MSNNKFDYNDHTTPNQWQDSENENIKNEIMKTWGRYCPACGSQKDKSSLKLIGKSGPAYQYISECHVCGLKTILNLVPNLGMQVTQLRTDVSVQEMNLFNQPLTSLDFLEFYARIKKVVTTKDLRSLFNN
jgi:hypothetical protein